MSVKTKNGRAHRRSWIDLAGARSHQAMGVASMQWEVPS